MTGKTEHTDFKASSVQLLAGLGNPGRRYGQTYHNVGIFLLEKLSGSGKFKQAGRSNCFVFFKSERYIFVRPDTFMNISGLPVGQALRYFNLTPDKLLVIHDDSDIALGDYKFSFGSRSAGHRGIQSIIDSLGTQKFWRLRIGVRAEDENSQAGDFVLRKISPAHRKILEEAFLGLRETYFEIDGEGDTPVGLDNKTVD